MIDLENAKNEFKKYISNYDLNNPEITRKVGHSYRVAEISKRIAKSLNLEQEEIELAELLGLLHDIGRFEQQTIYKTYDDIYSIDHGELGVKILENNEYIRKYIENSQYDKIIKTAIFNHNKYEIEENLEQKTILFCKIIRDSDKLDILYEAIAMFWKDEIKVQDGISQKVLKDFKDEKSILNQDKITELDKAIGIISFIYDINYLESFKIIKENDYINKIMDKFEIENTKVKEEFEEIRKIANKYIENKIQKER